VAIPTTRLVSSIGQAGKPQGALMGVGNGRMQKAKGCL